MNQDTDVPVDIEPDPAEAIVDARGRTRAQRRVADKRCPKCTSGPERRVLSAGFGTPHDVCSTCGYDFHGERTL